MCCLAGGQRAAGGGQDGTAGPAGKQITTGKEKTCRTFFLYIGRKIYLLRKVYR